MIISLILLLSGIKRDPNGENEPACIKKDYVLDKQVCLCLKGICAIYLMLGHYNMQMPFDGFKVVLLPVQPGAILVNGLFFFISGYGLMYSSITKSEYLSLRSYTKRVLNIGIVAYLSYLISLPLFYTRSIIDCFRHFCLFNLISWFHLNDPTWFLIELFFLYTLFWIIYATPLRRVADLLLGGTIFVWYVIAIVSGRGVVWYGSTLCFLLGIIAAKRISNNICKVSGNIKIYTLLLNTILIACLLFCMLYNEYETHLVYGAIFCNFAAVLFCLFILLFLQKYRICNRVLVYLGNISFELYMVHIYMIKWTIGKMSNNAALWLSIILSLLVATVTHLGVKIIKSICNI